MPTYEYRCNECLALQVISRDIDDRDEEVICVCGEQMNRIYNTPGIQFKGSGFYSTTKGLE